LIDTRKNLFILGILLALALVIVLTPIHAQQIASPPCGVNAPGYVAIKETSLSSAAEKVTVQQPATSPVQVSFSTANVYCSVACDITLTMYGTAATATTLTPTAIGLAPGAQAVAFSGSNVGTGITIAKYSLGAGATINLDISKLSLARGQGGIQNLSIGTSSITGTARIQIFWTESGNQ